MDIPLIKISIRNREYNLYTKEQRMEVVSAYLFEGLSHRKIDKEILKLDDKYSRGYQSMGILHHLGLNKEFKGIFKECSIENAILQLKSKHDKRYNNLISILEDIKIKQIDINDIENDIISETSQEYRIETEGKQVKVYTTKYERNPKLRKAAIQIHGTKCMACGFDFGDKYGNIGRNYIEVHHIVPLSKSKETDINPEKDLIVLCSNCHRIVHRKRNYVLSLEELKNSIKFD